MAGFICKLRSFLAHPLMRGMDLDDPRTTTLRRDIVRAKPFLRQIYGQWYATLAADLPAGDGRVLELGSGAGYFRDIVPDTITSEIFVCPGIDLVLNGQQLPFADASLRAIVMTDVFHHLPRAQDFLHEAARCVRVGGIIAMIEPWATTWSRRIYTSLHHEPFQPDAPTWEFPPAGPLSGANQALPWIVFQRDRDRLARDFPQWRLETARPMMPLRYLLSGGVSLRSLLPGWTLPLVRGVELLATPINSKIGMFAHIVLRRVDETLPSKAEHEIDHGKFLAAHGAEEIWGWGTPAGRLRAARRAELIAQAAGLKPGMRVLEVGCGTGLFTEMFARSGAEIVAVDISPELLEIARGRDADRVRFVLGRFEDCELFGPFDAVVGSSVLHHLELAPALTKIAALLRPGGRVSFAEPNMLNPQIALQKNVPWIKRRLGDSPDETAFVRWRLRRAMERAGFIDVQVSPFDWLHPATPLPLISAVRSAGQILEHVPLLREFAGSVICRGVKP